MLDVNERFDAELRASVSFTTTAIGPEFATALTLFPLPRLESLAAAIRVGWVASGSYGMHHRRCLFGWLGDWQKLDDCYTFPYPDARHFLAVRRVIKAFDAGLFTVAQAGRILARAIRQRRELNAAEERMIEVSREAVSAS